MKFEQPKWKMADNSEFDLIKKYFTPPHWRKDVILGVGDDCALLDAPTGKQLAATVDTLVSGVHFPVDASPSDIAYKSIAVNLSDLAAMGAEPAWLTLSLTLPDANDRWLSEFSESFFKTAKKYDVQVIGGDTTQGELSVTVQATGFVDPDRSMRRGNAKPGDLIYVTGTLGDAALGLKLLSDTSVQQEKPGLFLDKLNRPVPRVEFARCASEYCECAIDISDGLAADLGHILNASSCGAEIYLDKLPVSRDLKKYFTDIAQGNAQGNAEIDWSIVLGGGDDYELCLALPESLSPSLVSLAESMELPLTCIGSINSGEDLRIIDTNGHRYFLASQGYEHFNKNG
jgi:thiamine-monophosphate kinase